MLTTFNPKLLEFIYELSLLENYYSDREISRRIKVGKSIITSKTVRRWFSYLHKKCFDYFPYIDIETIGLEGHFLFRDLEEGFVRNSYNAYATIAISSKEMKKKIIQGFWLPKNTSTEVKKSLGKIERYRPKERVFGPFHLMFNREGEIKPLESLTNQQLKEINRVIESAKMEGDTDSSYVKRNPLIVPTIFEYDKEHISSVEVWKRIKNKLGVKVWQYFRKTTPKSDHMGIKKIQQSLKELKNNEMIKYMNVVYAPFEYKNRFIWVKIKTNVTKLKKLLKEIALESPIIFVYQSKDNKMVFLLNILTTTYLLDTIMSKLIDYSSIEDFFIINYSLSKQIWSYKWMKFDYTKNFDPLKKDWKLPKNLVEEISNFRDENIEKSCCIENIK